MPQLDSLRGLAVFTMIFFHWTPDYIHFLIPSDIGLKFFFVLSGFLLTTILLNTNNSSFTVSEKLSACLTFYIRRFLRIVPLYYIVILLACLIGISSVRSSWLWHVSYLSNFFLFNIQDWYDETSHFWFLAVLTQFYIFWPLLVCFLPRSRLGQVFVPLISFSILFRMIVPVLAPDVNMLSVLPVMYLDAFVFGSLLGYLADDEDRLNTFVAIAFWGIPLYVLFQILIVQDIVSPIILITRHESRLLGLTWLVFHASQGFGGVVGKILENNTLRYLGKISYGLFLLHNFSGILITFLNSTFDISLPRFGIVTIILRTLFTISLAMVSYHFLENPINRLKKYFPYPGTIKQESK